MKNNEVIIKEYAVSQLKQKHRRFEVSVAKYKIDGEYVDVLRIGALDCPFCGKEKHFRIFIPLDLISKETVNIRDRENIINIVNNTDFRRIGYICFRCKENRNINLKIEPENKLSYNISFDLFLEKLNKKKNNKNKKEKLKLDENKNYIDAINFLNDFIQFDKIYLHTKAKDYLKKRFGKFYNIFLNRIKKTNLNVISIDDVLVKDYSNLKPYLYQRICFSSNESDIWSCRSYTNRNPRYLTLPKYDNPSMLIIFYYGEKRDSYRYLFATEGILDILSLFVLVPESILKETVFVSYNGLPFILKVLDCIKDYSVSDPVIITDSDIFNKNIKLAQRLSTRRIFYFLNVKFPLKDINDYILKANNPSFDDLIKLLIPIGFSGIASLFENFKKYWRI